MKKKLGLLVIVLVAFVGILAGCQKDQKAGTSPEVEKKDLKFVVVPKVVHPWFDEVNKGAQEQAKVLEGQLGVKVKIEYIAPQTADVTEQNTILEQAAATRPDGIAVDPLDAEGNKQVIEEIRKQGIPVIVFDSPSPEGSDLTSVGNDFYEQGVIAAEKLAELLNYKGKVAVMQGFPTAPNHQQRYEAQVEVLKQYPGITVIDGGISNDDIQTAQQQATAILAANPDLAGYLMSDASGPIGIPAAIKEAGREGEVIAVGMDSLKPILEEVKGGVLSASSATIPRMQGSMSILMLWQAAIGVDIPKTIDTGIDVVTPENVDDFLADLEKE
ncbi:substrate-binding domain-containing protein [Fredinandcohnia sp. QZ13]|uniref:substrate-binding domain-containing protein n=1 Tax=Fredinandcohnia sp. QZ13 TaxID=3073144 RepID=UPI002853258B|nr:substrate-binding domain-containing protein [Fredinandcohnia sp. QZ13]MDR4889552.1 substrate-binding domain-containing protein [Fredinandcohnia sp. QZ13]